MSILLVDDEPANLLALQSVLENLGANLICANSGKEALKRVLETDFVLILLDVQMPDMSGLETAQLLRGMSRFEHIPLLFLTAHESSQEWPRQAYALGAVDFLIKPFLPAALRAKVTVFLELYRLRQQEQKRAQQALREQHELWRATLNSISDAVIATDVAQRVTFLNPGAERLTGWSTREAIGQNIDAILVIAQAGGSGPVLISRDGQQWPIEDTLSSIQDATGRVYGAVRVFRDITERKRAEEALQRAHDELEARVRQRTAELARQKTFLRAVLDNVNDGVVACNAEGMLTLYNRAAEDLLELPDMPLAQALRGERVSDLELVVATDDRTRRVLLANGQSFAGEDGDLLGAVISLRDVTRERQTEEERLRGVRRLEESNRELEQFATVASHDLQEPLRKIQAFSDRLREDCGPQLDERGNDHLARILAATGRMRTLIDDLLAYSRVVRKGQPFVEVDLDRLASEVVSDLEQRLADVKGRVELGPLPPIEADPTQMRQLLQNLIGNALKFRHPERAPVVRVEGREIEGGWCELAVADNGIGFEPQYAERIFQMFQRLHGRGRYEGNGIGLAICRRIVERHDGTVTAMGEPGQGATFQIRLHRHPPREA